MVTTTVKSGEARIRWRDLLDQVLTGRGDVMIERNGKNVAVMIPAADYEQIREELDEMRSVREAAAAYEAWKRDPSVARPFEDTASIPLDLYEKLVSEREERFKIIEEIRAAQEDRPIEEVERDVAQAIAKVRGQNVASGD
jgi:prevent-host-death family protein